MLDGEEHWLTRDLLPGELTIAEQIERAGAVAGAEAFHRRARGYAREETFAVGDSREDLACAGEVGVLWLVAPWSAARLDESRHYVWLLVWVVLEGERFVLQHRFSVGFGPCSG